MGSMKRAIKMGRYYRFANKASGKDLNHYAPGGSNVNVYTEDGSTDQIWRYSTDGRLYPESNPTKCLDRFTGSSNPNNADVYTPDDAPNQVLTFDPVTDNNYGYYYRIKVNGYYLTQQGSDVKWTSSPNGDYSVWLAEELIKVTDIPNGTNSTTTDYFSVWSGFTNGYFPEEIQASIDNLYRKCFGSAGAITAKYYNMYGAIFTGSSPASYKGKFHTGVDLAPGKGTTVLAPVSGEVVYAAPSNFGTVTIKEAGTDRLFLFMHMTGTFPKIGPIKAGDKIGEVGGIGANGNDVFLAHLHVEIHPAGTKTERTGDDYQVNSFFNEGVSVPVHNFF